MVRLAPFINTGFAAILNNADDDAADPHDDDDDGGGVMTGSNSNPSAVTSSSPTSSSSLPLPPAARALQHGNNNNILSTGNPADAMPFQSPVKTTRVDGIGIWRSWKRNFSTPLLALLDLIDNSLDAAIASQLELLLDAATMTASRGGGPPSFVGRVHIHPDTYDAPHPHRGSGNLNGATSTTTGVCIVNNSHKKIRPLAKVLEVYNSSKIHSGAGDIGENGVGLKQGCATLSQLSFVLVKNGGNDEVELGIVAESLQRLEGCYLPAFQFDNSHGPNNPSLHRQMQALFSQPQHQDIAACIAKYGAPQAGSPLNLSIGIERLCRKFDDICYRFHDCDHVFAIVLDKVVHGMNNEKTGAASSNEHRVRVQEYMRALQEELPKTYLHIPDDFEFLIDGKKLAFKHWPTRLVELSVFPLTVSKTQPLLKMRGNFHELEEGNVENSYRLRVFLGFDKERVVIKDAKKEASLYIYSRQSGRLIKVVADSRTDLSLSAGGTMFCQGLTIIIDDIGGNLPLNPTKQDVAFGEENCGGIHKENLYQSIGAVTNFYYNYHLEKYAGRKQVLTRKIADLADARVNTPFKSIDSANVTTFDNVKFKKAQRNIRIITKPMPEEVIGDDTVFRLERPIAQPTTSGRKRPIEAVSSASVPMQPQLQPQPLLPAPVTSSQFETQSIPRRSLTAPAPPREPTATPVSHASTTVPAATSRSSQSQSQSHSARKLTGILRNRVSPAKAQNGHGHNPNRSPAHDNTSRRNSKYFTQQQGMAQQPVTQEDGEEEDVVSNESEDLEMDDSMPSPIVSGTPASPSSRNGDDAEVADSEDDNDDPLHENEEGQLVINESTPPNIILSEMEKYQDLCEQLTLKVESEKEARKREKKELKKEFKRENAELKLENERLMARVAELERMVAVMSGRG
mmetsp:Transcript_19671/g.38708  ORF Transcript_19671/g.38708 Transcript_19671/m.38708 type:complete len:910 (+) Transcript_19671:179-2908(+)